MASFTKREKIITGISIILSLLVLFLSIIIVDHNIDVHVLGGDKISERPSMIESIEKASMIFICNTEIESTTVRYRISDIIHKDGAYDFYYGVGEVFPRLQQQVEKGFHYGEGRVVILSNRGPIVFQHLQIMSGRIAGFNGISVDEFIQKVKTIKH